MSTAGLLGAAVGLRRYQGSVLDVAHKEWDGKLEFFEGEEIEEFKEKALPVTKVKAGVEYPWGIVFSK